MRRLQAMPATGFGVSPTGQSPEGGDSGEALRKGTGEYPEKGISGEAPEKGLQGRSPA